VKNLAPEGVPKEGRLLLDSLELKGERKIEIELEMERALSPLTES